MLDATLIIFPALTATEVVRLEYDVWVPCTWNGKWLSMEILRISFLKMH